MKMQSQVIATFTEAIAAAVALIGQFNERAVADPDAVHNLFAELERLVEALPPDQHFICHARNRLPSCRDLWAAGEHMAARAQMAELVRKLVRHKAAWENDQPAAVAQPAFVGHNGSV